MVPMRSVPHRVVVLLGLDDDVFPRAHYRRRRCACAESLVGERDLRSEDRQLLLDAVMSASERVLLFYTGADAVTGAAATGYSAHGDCADDDGGHAPTTSRSCAVIRCSHSIPATSRPTPRSVSMRRTRGCPCSPDPASELPSFRPVCAGAAPRGRRPRRSRRVSGSPQPGLSAATPRSTNPRLDEGIADALDVDIL